MPQRHFVRVRVHLSLWSTLPFLRRRLASRLERESLRHGQRRPSHTRQRHHPTRQSSGQPVHRVPTARGHFHLASDGFRGMALVCHSLPYPSRLPYRHLTSQRQTRCYDRPRPPSELASHLSQDTFDKAQRYGRDKTAYSLTKAIFNQLVAWGIISTRLYARAWAWTGKWMDSLGVASNRMVRQGAGRRA